MSIEPVILRRRTSVKGNQTEPDDSNYGAIRTVAKFAEVRFDTKTLPADMQRVYKLLTKQYGEEYALLVIFLMRTAVELHRAWHMTLLTSKILQQIKDKFRLRITWQLGVFRLAFKVEDGGKELNRKVPYDYDSENQDIYMRIAIALMDGHINVHEALTYQTEAFFGEHSATSGKFLRAFPGRLVLYPGVAATCAVIFFGGDWTDFWITALSGLASGLVEMILGLIGGGMLTDVMVGTSTGIIGGLFYRFLEEPVCIQSIFLGTLYWFFYGTAFVIGILEIIAGELEVGVTRFIAVSVKTFVLCLGASFGLLVVGNATEVWHEQAAHCNNTLDQQWWRIPLYLLCSVFVLGQYRFPVVRYWRALIVMLAGYEVQYQAYEYFKDRNGEDTLDVAISNVFGAAASVLAGCAVSYYVNQIRFYGDGRILRESADNSPFGNFVHNTLACGVRLGNVIGLGRSSDVLKLKIEKKLQAARRQLKDPAYSLHEIILEPKEQNLILETIVGSQDMNIWSILMPALYQLVPGSLIAKLWFGYIFPPPVVTNEVVVEGSVELLAALKATGDTTFDIDRLTYTVTSQEDSAVFGGLMIVSTSLALGLVVGFAAVQVIEKIFSVGTCFDDNLKTQEQKDRAKSRRAGMYSLPPTKEDDPGAVALEFRQALLEGASTKKQADKLFNAVDWDQSDTIDQSELSDYMLNAGLSLDQVDTLFSAMDADKSGEVSREEFCRVILDKSNAGLLKPVAEGTEEGSVDAEEQGREDPDEGNKEPAPVEGNKESDRADGNKESDASELLKESLV